jgi:hypothetical protein
MSAEQLFAAANTPAALSWLLLAVLPGRRWVVGPAGWLLYLGVRQWPLVRKPLPAAE